MKRHRRNLAFDAFEPRTLLSTLHPAVGHASPEVHKQTPKMPPFVLSVVRAAERIGRHVVSVEPVALAPGSLAEYQITFVYHQNTYTTDITIDAPPPHGDQPVPGWDSIRRPKPACRCARQNLESMQKSSPIMPPVTNSGSSAGLCVSISGSTSTMPNAGQAVVMPFRHPS
jgi:hypothetical protein